MSSMNGLYESMAKRSDASAIATLLGGLPVAIRQDVVVALSEHGDGFSGMRHDAQTEHAYFVVADVVALRVWTFPRINFIQSAELWSRIDADPSGDLVKAKAAYQEVTGYAVDWVQ